MAQTRRRGPQLTAASFPGHLHFTRPLPGQSSSRVSVFFSVFVSTTTSVGALWPGSDTRRFHSQSVGKDDSRGRPQTRRQLGSGQRGAQGEEGVDFDDARALSATIVLSVIVRTTNNI